MLAGQTIAVVMAHPDDAEILCYGTLKLLTERGANVSLLIVTEGESGAAIDSPEANTLSHLRDTRRTETIRALSAVTNSISWLDEPDGSVALTSKLISKIEKFLKDVEPDVLITHYVDRSGIDHQDHQAVGIATSNAATRVSSIETILHPQPHSKRVPFHPNCYVQIDNHLKAKINSLSHHLSQAGRKYLTNIFTTSTAKANGYAFSASDEVYSEAFHISFLLIKD